jgi:hypothetical protein
MSGTPTSTRFQLRIPFLHIRQQTSVPNRGDTSLQFVSPTQGQRFTPGDTVSFVVVTYHGKFVIPPDFSGSSTLSMMAIDSKGNPFDDPGVTIVVRPERKAPDDQQ